MLLFSPDRFDRYIRYPQVEDITAYEYVVRHTVAVIDIFKRQNMERLPVHCRIPRLRIGDKPVSACNLGHEGQH